MFDIDKIPFSSYGNYLVISPKHESEDNYLYIRYIGGGDTNYYNSYIFKIDIEIELTEFKPYELIINSKNGGRIYFSFMNSKGLCFKIEETSLNIEMETGRYDYCYKPDKKSIYALSSKLDQRFLFESDKKIELNEIWNKDRAEKVNICFKENQTVFLRNFEVNIDKLNIVSYDLVLNRQKQNFSSFLKNDKLNETEILAKYITWSSVVSKKGKLTKDAMYMSKNWMNNIWSWDHCFNALALTKEDFDLSFAQLQVIFDNQHSSGMLPDFVNDKISYYAFTKPPIHGWTITFMMDLNKKILNKENLLYLFDKLEKWTNYWLKEAVDESGIPYYRHGNESGWDNSTLFQFGVPVKTPDLLPFLILQMRTLSDIALKLDNLDKHIYWFKKYENSYKKFMDIFWDGSKFICIKENIPYEDFRGNSLISYIPIILGDLLPEDIMDKLCKDLFVNKSFLTKYGLATESIDSELYISDGYWRGPIWAPSSFLIIDGLWRGNKKKEAEELAERFILLCEENGLCENYNAVTGEGLRDKAFTWTASVYLMLKKEYYKR